MATLTVRLSGRTHSAALEASAVPTEGGWPQPRIVRRGRGLTYIYAVDEEVADHMRHHLQTLADCFAGGEDEAMSRDRQAILRDINRNWTER